MNILKKYERQSFRDNFEFFLGALAAILFTAILYKPSKHQMEAVDKGLAKWEVVDNRGNTKFVWITQEKR